MDYDGPERRQIPDDIHRRLSVLERLVDNGRFVRNDLFRAVVEEIKADVMRLQSSIDQGLSQVNQTMREDREAWAAERRRDREARENDRKGIRNLVLGAFFSAGAALLVSFIAAAASKP